MNYCLDWSNDEKGGILAICNESRTLLLSPECLPSQNRQSNQLLFEESQASYEKLPTKLVEWKFFPANSEEFSQGMRVEIAMSSTVKFVAFHEKGDYLATVSPQASQQNDVVLIHSLHKAASQRPFNKSKAGIQKVAFHPTKPILFILTQKNTYVYNLQKQVYGKGKAWLKIVVLGPCEETRLGGALELLPCGAPQRGQCPGGVL